jgi:plastocyanin
MKVKRYLILMLLMVLALAACAENEAEDVVEPTAVPEQAEVPTTVPAEEPTAVPTPEPVEAAHGEHTAVSDPADPVEEAAPRFGLLRFRDSDTALAGSFQLLMENVPPAPAGTHYELWLRDDSFNTLNLGEFSADGTVQFSGSTDKNLLAAYSGAFISIEPDGVADGEIGPIAFNGTVPGGSLLHIRHVVTAFPTTPDNKAFLIGAQGELHHALEHAGFLLDELANNNIREAQRHAEHVVNILDGENGPNFGDLDGDTVAQNPGDGFGVREYFIGAQEHAQLASDAEGATAEVKLHAGHVIISSQNGLNSIEAAMAEALRIIASDSAAAAQPAADKLAQLLLVALEGQDANGDGSIAPIENEGGWQTAYEHALFMGAFELFAADGVAPAAAEAAPVAEAAPTETAAPAEPAANVTIEMANFAFQPNVLTVAPGTAVTWNNQDSGPRHSATAADGSFDTGLFDAGESATLTFDTPGIYVYYCTLHGSPDGSGMAATITVSE